MTLVTWELFQASPDVWFKVTWDSPMITEDPNDPTGNTYITGDPSATHLVSAITYQNLSSYTWQLSTGTHVYRAAPRTPQTTINIPRGQQFRYDEAAYWEFRRV